MFFVEIDDIQKILKITSPKGILIDDTEYENFKDAAEKLELSCDYYIFGKTDISSINKIDDLLKETGTESKYVPPFLGNPEELPAVLHYREKLNKVVIISHANLNSAPT